ncbi:divalent metal cation transporter MntH [mine drainage metagenome]|uniref:Divalent metal cation transporter MntH n=1 Tax=mine drainage metagenome TaxID=410659 RepID=A0A1J5S4P7_9ZZZZ
MSIFRNGVKQIKKQWKIIGPGFITGASDNDPSAITTYTQAGAKFGIQFLWTSIITYPLTIAVLEMCARIGLTTHLGIIAVIKKFYSKTLLYFIGIISFVAILLNISADIEMVGSVTHLLYPSIPSFIYSIIFSGLLVYSIIMWSYNKIISVLKILCIALLSYAIIPFLTKTNWTEVAKSIFMPSFKNSASYFLVLVAIFGSAISPYLFFWQASVEIEDAQLSKSSIKQKLNRVYKDIKGGIFFTSFISFFIVLAAANVLFLAGINNIDTVDQAAMALKPLAGKLSYVLFAIGIIGTGLLAVPVLAGSLSYIMAETFGWEQGLNKKFHEAKGFYFTLIISLIIGTCLHFLKISPVKALISVAILYGILAPVLVMIILIIANNKKIMGSHTNSKWSNFWGILAFLIMTTTAIITLYFI